MSNGGWGPFFVSPSFGICTVITDYLPLFPSRQEQELCLPGLAVFPHTLHRAWCKEDTQHTSKVEKERRRGIKQGHFPVSPPASLRPQAEGRTYRHEVEPEDVVNS